MRTIYDIYDKNPIEQKNHILTVSKEALEGEFKDDVKELINYLWENPYIILTLLKKSANKEDQNKLIYIIMNTFYENIFSSNIIDETLLGIISLLLKDEINNFKKKEEKELFLNDSLCGNLMGEFFRKPEITKYFRKILESAIMDINDITNEIESPISNYVINNRINLNVNDIEEKINQKIVEKEKLEKNRHRKHNNSFSVPENFVSMKFNDIRIKSETFVENNDINTNMNKSLKKENKEEYESFVKKYFDNITKDILIEQKDSIEDNKMKEYLQYQLDNLKQFENNNNINNIEGIYTNQTVLKNIYGSLVSSKILAVYQRNFAIVIKALNKILENFLENINELPYNLKQICKIIAILLNKRFPDLKAFERNSFLGIFIIDKIIFPLFQDPKINCLISKIERNDDLYFNFNFIASLLSDFSLGYLFCETEKNGNYTPFNGYFLEKMPILMQIYEKILDVEIPGYLEDLLNEKENNLIEEKLNFLYGKYFDRHNGEFIYTQSCCLSFGNLEFILNEIKKCEEQIFIGDKNAKLNNIINKINQNKNYKELLSIKIKKEDEHPVMSSDKNTKEKKDINLNCLIKPTVEYFIINNILFIDKYKYFFDININTIYIDLNEIKQNENDINNLLGKALCEMLFSIPSISELIEMEQIKKESLNNFSLIINDLHKYISFVNSIDIFYKKYLSIQYSSNLLLENINNIEGKLKENNYSLFFNQIEEKLNSLINEYNFDDLASCLNNLTYGKIKQEIIEISLLKLKKINTNSIVNRIITEFPIYIRIETKELITKTKENNKINIKTKLNVDIKRARSKEKKKVTDPQGIYINEKNNYKIYKTIYTFIKFFNLANEPKINQLINDLKEKEKENKNHKKDIYDYIKIIEFPEKIISFLNTTLKTTITDMLYIERINKTEIPYIIFKTNKRIISGLYILFKNYFPNDKDNDLYQKTKSLSWTDINHFINDKYHLYDTIFLFIVNCLKKFQNKKTVSGKITCIQQIKNILSNVHNISKIKYSSESFTCNYYLNPLLIYGIIKSQPKSFFLDIKFIETFIDIDLKNKFDYTLLIEELKCYLNYILDLNYNNLNGNITIEEYNNLCNKSLENKINI